MNDNATRRPPLSGLVLPPAPRVVRSERCENCKFATTSLGPNGPQLECRRFPPGIVSPAPQMLTTVFPVIAPEAWCGEWRNGALKLDS